MAMSERIMKRATVYEVLQNGTVVCGYKMGLTKREAQNKIENERRLDTGKIKSSWSIKPARVMMEQV